MEREMKFTKEEIHIDVLICGDEVTDTYCSGLFPSKQVSKPSKVAASGKRIFVEEDENFGWTFKTFQKGLNEETFKDIVNEIKSDNGINSKKYPRCIVICFIKIDDLKWKELIKSLDNLPDRCLPFVIFVSQDESLTISNIFKFIEDNECAIDKRNCEVIYFNGRNQVSFIYDLWEKSCYYNELGDEIKLPDSKNLSGSIPINKDCINFLLVSVPGRGKSTLVNVLNGKKIAQEGIGTNVTTKISQYKIRGSPICLYDCPGFSYSENDSINSLTQQINKLQKDLDQRNDRIHGIFYLLSPYGRSYDDEEKKFINYILSLDIDVYFLINFSAPTRNLIRFKKQLKEDLRRDFPNYYEKMKLNERIFEINIIKTESQNCLGLSGLFNYLYKNYEKDIVDIRSMENSRNYNEALNFVKNSRCFKNLQTKEQILKNVKGLCYKEIYGFSAAAGGIGAIPFNFGDAPLIFSLQAAMIIIIAKNFGSKIERAEAMEKVKALTSSFSVGGTMGLCGKYVARKISKAFSCVPGVGLLGGAICFGTASIDTAVIGKAAVELYSSLTTDKYFKNIILEKGKSFNSAINFFNRLKEAFHEKNDYFEILLKYEE